MGPRRCTCTVAREVDGDTIRLVIGLGADVFLGAPGQGVRCRLGRINTPELHDPDPVKQARAKAALARVTQLCPVGSTVTIDTTWLQDDYGRWLVELYPADGSALVSVNDILLHEGLADPWPAVKVNHHEGDLKL